MKLFWLLVIIFLVIVIIIAIHESLICAIKGLSCLDCLKYWSNRIW
jgi:hypothetical protein